MEDNKKLSLQESQRAALEVLKKIVGICEENGFKYFLIYGTLIGAVREGGIIPWDDDIDIMMPRPDYDKFVEYCVKERESLKPFELFNNNVNPKYPHMISRFSDSRYHLVFDNEKDYGLGVFVDIYPLDGVGNDLKAAKKLIKKTKKLASLCFLTSRKKFGRDNTSSALKMLVKFPAYLYAKMMGNKHFAAKLNRYAKKYDYDKSRYVACAIWPNGNINGEDCDVFEKDLFEIKAVPFEDGYYNIPVGYDKLLTVTYGNYMQPPKEENRTFNHSYSTYLKSE